MAAKSAIFEYLKDVDVVHLQAFVGGYYDASGYLLLHGVFTASITGNLVIACASIGDMKGVLCRALVSIFFFLAGCIGSTIAIYLKKIKSLSARKVSLALFSLELLLMISVLVSGLALEDQMIDDLNQWQVIFVSCLMGTTMGFHNVAMKESIANCPPTTVMTSTLINVASNLSTAWNVKTELWMTKPTNDNAEALAKLTAKYNEWFGKFSTSVKPLITFLIGAIVGSTISVFGSFWMAVVPMMIVIMIMSTIYMKERNLTAADLKANLVANADNNKL